MAPGSVRGGGRLVLDARRRGARDRRPAARRQDGPGAARTRVERVRDRAHPDHGPLPRAQCRARLGAPEQAVRHGDLRPRALCEAAREQRGARRAEGRRDARGRHPGAPDRQSPAQRAPVRDPVPPRARVRRRRRRDGKGALRVWDDPVESASRKKWWDERFLPTLRPLAKLDVERVLVTHGQPVLKGGAKALAKAFGQPPWQR